jgi:hypothetical protein
MFEGDVNNGEPDISQVSSLIKRYTSGFRIVKRCGQNLQTRFLHHSANSIVLKKHNENLFIIPKYILSCIINRSYG